MTIYSGYQAASRVCSGGPTPGAQALMAWFLGAYAGRGRNDGIYNCRNQRGSAAPSVHGEGRAADLGCNIGDEWAQTLANWLVAHSGELGIQCVIFNHHIWSGAHPTEGWRWYGGVDQHTTHLHVELSRAAAQTLTVDRIQAVQAAGRKPVKRMTLSRYLHRGSTGLAVANLQREFTRRGHPLTADGSFGPATEQAVRIFQRRRHLTVDGIVGKSTALALGWAWKG